MVNIIKNDVQFYKNTIHNNIAHIDEMNEPTIDLTLRLFAERNI